MKVLMCGIDASSPQWCSCIFMICYTHLNLAILLHKTATAKYILHSTVSKCPKVITFDFNSTKKVIPDNKDSLKDLKLFSNVHNSKKIVLSSFCPPTHRKK